MKALRAYPSVVAVLALELVWLLYAVSATSPALWAGEDSPVERFEVALLAVYAVIWVGLALALHRLGGPARTARTTAAALMVAQLALVIGEELDWGGVIPGARNLRMASRAVVPAMLDSPAAGAYLLAFVLAPWIPLAAVRRGLDRLAPVRAERPDAAAFLLGLLLPLAALPLVDDPGIGELHQLCLYTILGVMTARIVKAVLAERRGTSHARSAP